MTSPDRCYYIRRDGDTIEVNLTKVEKGIDIGLNIDKNEETWLHPVEILFSKALEVAEMEENNATMLEEINNAY